MPDPKEEWSLIENNSELHYGICSKVNQFIYNLVCNYMQYIRILAKVVLQIFCSQGCSYTKCMCPENRNIKIIAKAVLQLFCSQDCSYTKCLCLKKGSNSTKINGIGSKVNQFIFTLVCNYKQNIRILAKAVPQLFCSQGCSYTKCLCPKKESYSTENLQNRFKS